MVKIIVDTSIFVEKIRTHKGLFDDLVSKSELGKLELYTSSIVLTELWMGFSMDKKAAVSEVEEILSAVTIIGIGGEVGKKAGELIRNKQSEGFDALVAATTIVHDMQLATLNVKHFMGIKGLKLYDNVK